MKAIIDNSENPSKKFRVEIFDDNNLHLKTIHFGAKGYSDYTLHKDSIRKERYINRHQLRENWNDPFTAGFWAVHLLWNKKTIRSSAKDITENFEIKLKLNV